MIRFACSNCGRQISVDDKYVGKKGKCPKCQNVMIVPEKSTIIAFHCERCGQKIRVAASYQGRRGKCPECKGIVVIPGSESPGRVGHRTKSPGKSPSGSASVVTMRCPVCEHNLQAPLSAIGKILECPSCGSFAEVPGKEGTDREQAAAQERRVRSTGTVACPSCDKKLADDATVCTDCGIYIDTGRPIITARGVDEDELYERSRRVIRPLSWIVPLGVYPVYSEAMGEHRPYATWAIATVTVMVSIFWLGLQSSGSAKMRSMKDLMLWSGRAQPSKEQIRAFYEHTNYGDKQAFLAKKRELRDTVASNEIDRVALSKLTPAQQCFGRFAILQLVSHAFLHGSLLHLAGNMLFLLVFGSRVNSVIGNIPMLILYPVLAVTAALTHLLSIGSQPPTAMLGASGAVMGMAGVYLLLFPVHRIHLTAWARWGFLAGFHLSFKCFALRGFWVVLFYIMFDFIAVAFVIDTRTAHWAHIGGFIWGLAICVVILVSGLGYSGSDGLSLILGKHAWPLIGSPYDRAVGAR